MVIVYTSILGGCDSLKPAPKGADRCVCFVDDAGGERNGWECVPWSFSGDPRRAAWHLRCIPHEVFSPHSTMTVDVSPNGLLESAWSDESYGTVIWVDASFTVTDLPRLLRDSEGHDLSALRHHKRHSCYAEATEVLRVGQATVKEIEAQMSGYVREGFDPSELSISCIIVRRNTSKVTAFNELWDAEIKKNLGDNTQLSLDYCAWKTGVGVHHLQGVRKDNPYAVHDHADHKKRRKPYR